MRRIAFSAFAVLLAPLAAHAQIVQWTGAGSNGHYYQAVATPTTLSWSSASSLVAAAGNGGYLATITSAAENSFVFSLIDFAAFWNLDVANNNQGPYLGGIQGPGAEPAGGWGWVTGETWNYTAWHPTQPDNNAGAENYLQYFGGNGNIRQAAWNDIGLNASDARAYVIEYNAFPAASAPEPSVLALLALPLVSAIARRRKTC